MENDAQTNAGANFAFIETHLQVSNLVKILLTIPYDILKVSVENVPEALQQSQHAKILKATLNFYSEVIESAPSPAEVPAAQEETKVAESQESTEG